MIRVWSAVMSKWKSWGGEGGGGRDSMVKLMWRLSGNLIYHVFSMKTPENLQTNFAIKSP